MKKGEMIRGYRVLEDSKVAGGMSIISFVGKGGETYFIKEFLSPKYPTGDSAGSERTKEKKRKDCDAFEKHHRDLNNAIGRCCAGKGGHLIYALDFFREGTTYYKITEKIDITSITCEQIARLPLESIMLIALSAVHSIKILHGLKIVHGDLKPDNLPIKEVPAGYVVKLIDFDDSYFEGNPPTDRDMLVGTPEYYSPEQAAYIMDEDEEISGSTLTCKSDIFTLGIIFSEYFSGEKPLLPTGYKETWKCVSDGKSFSFKKPIPTYMEDLIRRMLSLNPSLRPTISEVHAALMRKDVAKPTEILKKPTLRGRGLSHKEETSATPKSTLSPIPHVVSASSTPKGSKLRGKGLEIAGKEK